MKELSIEEKAKAYDKVIEIAKSWYADAQIDFKKSLETLFPELKESDDEKIRKAIIECVKNYGPSSANPKLFKNMLSWLEKQAQKLVWSEEDKNMLKWVIGYLENKMLNTPISEERTACKNAIARLEKLKDEQKSVDKVEPKFHEGEWVVWQNKCYKVNYNGCGYELVDQNGLSTSLEYGTIDENAHLWNITKDAKDGDVLFLDLMGGKTFIYNGVNPNMAVLYSFIISNDGEDVLPYHIGKPNTGIGNIEENKNIIHPAMKEQRDLLFQKMKETGYEWDAEKKELKKIEEEYNGEDYGIDGLWHAQSILEKTLGKVDGYQTDDGILEHKCAISAVKKLYEQSRWKPSDEQIKALGDINLTGNISYAGQGQELINLYNDLKKLKD